MTKQVDRDATSKLNSKFMKEAIVLSQESVRSGKGGPFGAIIIKEGKIIAQGQNQVTSTNDPTAHAEIVAIREACRMLETFQLPGCELYTSCEPCPMCLGAIYWARLDKVYYANTKVDAAQIGFDDQFIYEELQLPLAQRHLPMIQMMPQEAAIAFQDWVEKTDKVEY
ncbi:MAG: nucleoside deaminase [Xenococcaceae cyanobacterium MO_188.B32]|nr:nucleoside deaminase [Xenococcaceae cyanobacterium MO_188.B32]